MGKCTARPFDHETAGYLALFSSSSHWLISKRLMQYRRSRRYVVVWSYWESDLSLISLKSYCIFILLTSTNSALCLALAGNSSSTVNVCNQPLYKASGRPHRSRNAATSNETIIRVICDVSGRHYQALKIIKEGYLRRSQLLGTHL